MVEQSKVASYFLISYRLRIYSSNRKYKQLSSRSSDNVREQ